MFENPANGYKVKVDSFSAFVWTTIFGPFYFLFRGNTLHFFLSLLFSLSAIGWFIYPFFAASILRRMYYERGYRVVEERPTGLKAPLIVAILFVSFIVFLIWIIVGRGTSPTSRSQATSRHQWRPGSAPPSAPPASSVQQASPEDVGSEPTVARAEPVEPPIVRPAGSQSPSATQPSSNQSARLSANQIDSWNLAQLQYAIDAIYARYGTEFPKRDTQAWAEHQPWYHRIPGRTPDIADQYMTAEDRFNIEILAARRNALRSTRIPATEKGHVTSASTPLPPDTTADTDAERKLRLAAARYVESATSSSPEDELDYYANEVAYYDEGIKSKDQIRADILSKRKKWPFRTFHVTRIIRADYDAEHDRGSVTLQYTYSVEDGQQRKSGQAESTIEMRNVSTGPKVIAVTEQKTR